MPPMCPETKVRRIADDGMKHIVEGEQEKGTRTGKNKQMRANVDERKNKKKLDH